MIMAMIVNINMNDDGEDNNGEDNGHNDNDANGFD